LETDSVPRLLGRDGMAGTPPVGFRRLVREFTCSACPTHLYFGSAPSEEMQKGSLGGHLA
jgi:hypothetical protein